MSTIEIVKKITFKTLAGVPSQSVINDAIKNDRTELPNKLCVLGYATGEHIQVNQDTGETYRGLSGDFIAYSPENPDKKVQSGILYAPDIVTSLLKGRLAGLGVGESVEFAVEIGVRLPRDGEKTPTGYIFTVKPLVKPAQNSPMLALMARVEAESAPVLTDDTKTDTGNPELNQDS